MCSLKFSSPPKIFFSYFLFFIFIFNCASVLDSTFYTPNIRSLSLFIVSLFRRNTTAIICDQYRLNFRQLYLPFRFLILLSQLISYQLKFSKRYQTSHTSVPYRPHLACLRPPSYQLIQPKNFF